MSSASDSATSSRAARAGEARIRVLVAEDDEEMRTLLSVQLERRGFEVRAARDGQETLAYLTASARADLPTPHVIVMDVRMPRCSGLDILTALRLAHWQTPVILMTGFGDATLHAQASALGAVRVLDKPFELDELDAAIRAVSILGR
jgi:DNA-binding response OmpR family regulator